MQFQIYIKTLTGKVITLTVSHNDTIKRVKELLFEKEQIPVDDQRLIYSGKQPYDDSILDDWDIRSESTLSLVLRLRDTSVPNPENDIPIESLFPSGVEARETVKMWQALGQKDNFDADTHIIDPQAHYAALDSLQETIVKSSELYRQSGEYTSGISDKATKVLSPDFNYLTKSPEWILNLILDIQDEGFGFSDLTVIRLCRCYAVFQSVLERFDILINEKFSSTFFSILVLSGNPDVAEIIKIPRESLEEIVNGLHLPISIAQSMSSSGTFETSASEIKALLLPIVSAMLSLFGCTSLTTEMLQLQSFSGILDILLVLAYLFDLGLVCYVGSHASRFDEEHFACDLSTLAIRTQANLQFDCSLRPLNCLHGFLNKKMVWVFCLRTDNIPITPPPTSATMKKLSILTTIDTLSDIWGPVWAETSNQDNLPVTSDEPIRVTKYHVSKGCIRRVRVGNNSSKPGIVECHWYSWAEEYRRKFSRIISKPFNTAQDLTMSLDDKLLIGTELTVSNSCTFTLEDYEMNFGDMIREAGPKPSTWRFDGVAAAIQIAAPKIIMFQIEGQTKKVPERTVKEDAWQKWNTRPESANPGILNSYYGVEISHCTGNARRVPLKQILLMGPVAEMLERQIPRWTMTPWGLHFEKALRAKSNDAVFQFWRQHVDARPLAGRLIFSVLDALEQTGATESGLQAAVLHQNHESVLTIDTSINDWAPLLKDSYLTAAYVVVSDVCREYRRPDHTTSICSNVTDQRFTVLQTEITIQKGSQFKGRVKIEPHGRDFKAVDQDQSDLERQQQRLLLLTPESGLASTLRLFNRAPLAKELLIQHPNHIRDHRVFLRASRQSFGGMATPRERRLLSNTARVQTDQEVKTDDVLSQNAIGAIINEELLELDAKRFVYL